MIRPTSEWGRGANRKSGNLLADTNRPAQPRVPVASRSSGLTNPQGTVHCRPNRRMILARAMGIGVAESHALSYLLARARWVRRGSRAPGGLNIGPGPAWSTGSGLAGSPGSPIQRHSRSGVHLPRAADSWLGSARAPIARHSKQCPPRNATNQPRLRDGKAPSPCDPHAARLWSLSQAAATRRSKPAAARHRRESRYLWRARAVPVRPARVLRLPAQAA